MGWNRSMACSQYREVETEIEVAVGSYGDSATIKVSGKVSVEGDVEDVVALDEQGKPHELPDPHYTLALLALQDAAEEADRG